MIRIEFTEPDTPEWKRWKKACEKKTAELIKAVKQGADPTITNLYKRKIIKKNVYFAIDGPFYGKCAYCETLIKGSQPGDMEHFRPVKAVTDEDDNRIFIEKENGETKPHPGYYWLAYDWKNLLLSCNDCNRPTQIGNKKIGKHNRFPVKNNYYAITPNKEDKEKPLLINPMFEDPEKHLEVNLKTGVLGYHTNQGKTCIDIFGLNDREVPLKGRKGAYSEARAILAEYIFSEDESKEKECVQKLRKIIVGKEPYSLVKRTAINMKFPGFLKYLSQKLFPDDNNQG